MLSLYIHIRLLFFELSKNELLHGCKTLDTFSSRCTNCDQDTDKWK